MYYYTSQKYILDSDMLKFFLRSDIFMKIMEEGLEQNRIY